MFKKCCYQSINEEYLSYIRIAEVTDTTRGIERSIAK